MGEEGIGSLTQRLMDHPIATTVGVASALYGAKRLAENIDVRREARFLRDEVEYQVGKIAKRFRNRKPSREYIGTSTAGNSMDEY